MNGLISSSNLHVGVLSCGLNLKINFMKKLPEYLNDYQLKELVKHMPTQMMKEAAIIMYVYALRISELCSLTKFNVHLEHDVVRITGKGKMRELTITEDTREILINAMKRPGKLFNVEVRSFRNYIYLAASRAGLGHVNPHMLRHSRATHMLNDGEQLPDIQAWMRHDFAGSTMIYTHIPTSRMREVGNRCSVKF